MDKFTLSGKSQHELDTCNERIKDAVNWVLSFVDVGVVYGYRNEQTQNFLFDNKASKLRYPDSMHNSQPSNAIDLIIYVSGIGYIDEKTSKRKYASYYAFLAGLLCAYCARKGYNFRWGGDWDNDKNLDDQSFDDLMHFEIW